MLGQAAVSPGLMWMEGTWMLGIVSAVSQGMYWQESRPEMRLGLPGTLLWDVGVSSGVFSAVPDACAPLDHDLTLT